MNNLESEGIPFLGFVRRPDVLRTVPRMVFQRSRREGRAADVNKTHKYTLAQ